MIKICIKNVSKFLNLKKFIPPKLKKKSGLHVKNGANFSLLFRIAPLDYMSLQCFLQSGWEKIFKKLITGSPKRTLIGAVTSHDGAFQPGRKKSSKNLFRVHEKGGYKRRDAFYWGHPWGGNENEIWKFDRFSKFE